MGKIYTVPRSAKGETRILYIFTIKSMLFTLAFAIIGAVPCFILNWLGFGMAGVIVLGVIATLGYLMATLTIPDAPIMGKLRKAGGEKLADILWRTLTFTRRKGIYIYREGGKKQWDKVH